MNPAETVIMAGAVVVAISAIALFVLKTYRILKRIDAVLGVDRQGRTISDRLERVEYQLFPNGGTSLTDKINRIEKEQGVLHAQIEALRAMFLSMIGGTPSERSDGTPRNL